MQESLKYKFIDIVNSNMLSFMLTMLYLLGLGLMVMIKLGIGLAMMVD